MKICRGKKCRSGARLEGKTAAVTGSNTGIGRETVKDFYIRGARVLMLCRNIEKAEETVAQIKKECEDIINTGEIVVEKLDLSSLKSVKECAERITQREKQLNILVNNAGLICPLQRSEDGYEMQFAVNHLGHFYLTLLLLPLMIKSAPSRIINVSSKAYLRGQINFEDLNWENRNYSSFKAYCQSKLANILFTKELAKRLEEAGKEDITVYSIHPGVVKTDIARNLKRVPQFFWNKIVKLFAKTPLEGAQTTIYCAVDDDLARESGLFYSDCEASELHRVGKDMAVAKKLWDVSWDMVKMPENFDPFKGTEEHSTNF